MVSCSDFSLFWGEKAENLNVCWIRTGVWAASLVLEIFFAWPISVMATNLIAGFGAWALKPSRVARSSWLALAYCGQFIGDRCNQGGHVWQRVDPPAL